MKNWRKSFQIWNGTTQNLKKLKVENIEGLELNKVNIEIWRTIPIKLSQQIWTYKYSGSCLKILCSNCEYV